MRIDISHKRVGLIFLIVLFAVAAGILGISAARSTSAEPEQSPSANESAFRRTPSDEILISPEDLQLRLDEVTILDYGRTYEEYDQGHIPGAAFVPRETAADEVDGIRGMLPDPELVAADLEDAGVSMERPVVVYDAGNSLWASRLFWALEYLGHPEVHVLDGGFKGWVGYDGPVSIETTAPARDRFESDVKPSLIVTKQELLEDKESMIILDARSAEEFRGEKIFAQRGGHIPGSINVEWVSHLSEDGRFKPAALLAELYQDIPPEPGPIVTLCQVGLRGAHTYLAMRILGYEDVRLYDGSWVEWGNDPNTPITRLTEDGQEE